ncbi:MAG: hypothetical protein ACREMW_02995 [Gemmatimonadales bacterium]
MRKMRLAAVALAATVAFGAPTACSDSGTGAGGTIDLTGNYNLVSLFFGVLTTTATGTLAFTSTSFSTNIHVTAPVDSTIVLAGAYAARHTSSGDSIYLTLPAGLGTAAGSFLIAGTQQDTLVISLSLGGSSLVTIWDKQ